jgi:hypothetical protein
LIGQAYGVLADVDNFRNGYASFLRQSRSTLSANRSMQAPGSEEFSTVHEQLLSAILVY